MGIEVASRVGADNDSDVMLFEGSVSTHIHHQGGSTMIVALKLPDRVQLLEYEKER